MVDVEQVVVHGQLVLGVEVTAVRLDGGPPVDEAAFLTRLARLATEVADATGMQVQVDSVDEEKRLKDTGYQDKMASAIFGGIKRYLAQNPPLARNKFAAN